MLSSPDLQGPQIHWRDCRSSVFLDPYSAFKINRGGYSVSPATSLELCTETLGCENGALCSFYETEAATDSKTISKRRPPEEAKSAFPPPLMTLRGAGRLRLLRKREEGRLLLIPFKPLILEAERSAGRLLLRFLPREEEEVGARNGGGESYRRKGGCKQDEGGEQGRTKRSTAAMFNCDSFWVTSS